ASATTISGGSGSTVRINSGGAAYTSQTGRVFSADTNVTGGATNKVTSPIAGTADQPLFQDERWGQFTYSIAVANGTYDVRLYFAELYYGSFVPGSCIGKRVFGMDIPNTAAPPDIPPFAICAHVGPPAALVKTVIGVSRTNGIPP